MAATETIITIIWLIIIFFAVRFVWILSKIPGRVKELERKVRQLENERTE